MRIQQAEELVGICKKNIRYYEEEGLLSPSRNSQNGYREYSLADVEALKKIKLLRKLGVPVAEIRRLQNGELTLAQILQGREERIRQEEKNLAEIREMCCTLSQVPQSLAELDPTPYLEQMAILEKGGVRFMDVGKDKRKRKKGAILAAAVVILCCIIFGALMVWGEMVDPLPLGLFAFLLLMPAVCIVGVLLALKTRIQEIEKGEQDESVHY